MGSLSVSILTVLVSTHSFVHVLFRVAVEEWGATCSVLARSV